VTFGKEESKGIITDSDSGHTPNLVPLISILTEDPS